jgi:hypothetical protein
MCHNGLVHASTAHEYPAVGTLNTGSYSNLNNRLTNPRIHFCSQASEDRTQNLLETCVRSILPNYMCHVCIPCIHVCDLHVPHLHILHVTTTIAYCPSDTATWHTVPAFNLFINKNKWTNQWDYGNVSNEFTYLYQCTFFSPVHLGCTIQPKLNVSSIGGDIYSSFMSPISSINS